MTKYRLKDQELQKHLDAISDGDFSRQIEGHLQNIKGRGITDADYRLFFGELSGRYEMVNRFSMLLYEHEIEAFEEYDPNDWNTFPDTTPPEGVLMRVELETSEGDVYRKCAIFENGNWWKVNESNGKASCIAIEIAGGKVKRFRPWE